MHVDEMLARVAVSDSVKPPGESPRTCTEEPVVEPTMDPEPLIDQR